VVAPCYLSFQAVESHASRYPARGVAMKGADDLAR